MDECDPQKVNLKTINLVNLDHRNYTELIDYFSKHLTGPNEMAVNRIDKNLKNVIKKLPVVVKEICCNCKSEDNDYFTHKCGCFYCDDCKNNIMQISKQKCLNPECNYKF